MLRDMAKERSSSLGMEGRSSGISAKGGDASLYRDGSDSKKRLVDVVEKSSPSTSKGGITREGERLAPSTSAPGRRLPAIDSRIAQQDKNRYQVEGAFLFSIPVVLLFLSYCTCIRIAL